MQLLQQEHQARRLPIVSLAQRAFVSKSLCQPRLLSAAPLVCRLAATERAKARVWQEQLQIYGGLIAGGWFGFGFLGHERGAPVLASGAACLGDSILLSIILPAPPALQTTPLRCCLAWSSVSSARCWPQWPWSTSWCRRCRCLLLLSLQLLLLQLLPLLLLAPSGSLPALEVPLPLLPLQPDLADVLRCLEVPTAVREDASLSERRPGRQVGEEATRPGVAQTHCTTSAHRRLVLGPHACPPPCAGLAARVWPGVLRTAALPSHNGRHIWYV